MFQIGESYSMEGVQDPQDLVGLRILIFGKNEAKWTVTVTKAEPVTDSVCVYGDQHPHGVMMHYTRTAVLATRFKVLPIE